MYSGYQGGVSNGLTAQMSAGTAVAGVGVLNVGFLGFCAEICLSGHDNVADRGQWRYPKAMTSKVTGWLASVACVVSLFFSASAIMIMLAMWPGFLMLSVGQAVIVWAVILSGPLQLVAVSKRRFGAALLLLVLSE